MHLSTAILGEGIVRQLNERQTSAVLTIGKDRYTRPQLSRLGCFNFLAAARLTALLTELEVKDTADLFNRFGPAHLALPGLGAISLATVGAAFEVKKLGTLMGWVNKHMEKGDTLVTFLTLKTNVLDQLANRDENRRAKHRKHDRLNKATKIRGDRHIERSTRLRAVS